MSYNSVRWFNTSLVRGYRKQLDTSKFVKNASFDKNFPKDTKVKAWVRAGEDKDTFFRKRYAHVHARELKSRNTRLDQMQEKKHDSEESDEFYSKPRRLVKKQVKYKNPLVQFVYGTSPVLAALKSDQRLSHTRLLIQGMNHRDEEIVKIAKEKGVYVENVDKHRLSTLTDGANHNGVVLETRPLDLRELKRLGPVSYNENNGATEYLTVDEDMMETVHSVVREKEIDSEQQPVCNPFGVFIDQVTNPHNMGALLRSAYFLGADFVVITTKNSAPLNPSVAKTSSGALDLMKIYTTSKPMKFMTESKSTGWSFISAGIESKSAAKTPKKKHVAPQIDVDNLNDLLIQGPCVLILGSEESGIRTNILKNSDFLVKLKSYRQDINEGESVVDSLNVSVAGALLMHRFFN